MLNVGFTSATYVVDVCGTLVRDDTTLGLLKYHFARTKRHPFRSCIFWLLTARICPARWAFVVLERIAGKHFLKHFLVRLLAGENMSELDASGAAYAKHLLSHRRVAPVWDLIGQAEYSG